MIWYTVKGDPNMSTIKTIIVSLLIATSSLLFSNVASAEQRNVVIPGLGSAIVDIYYTQSIDRYMDGIQPAAAPVTNPQLPFYVFAVVRRGSVEPGTVALELKTVRPDGSVASIYGTYPMGTGAHPNCVRCDRVVFYQGPFLWEHISMYGDFTFILFANGMEVGRLSLRETR